MKTRDLPSVSIVVLTYNSIEHISDLLVSLFSLSYENYRIVMLDNASEDGTVQLVKEQFPFTDLIVNTSNLGYGRANNLAMSREFARGADYVLVLNPDVSVEPDFLVTLIKGAIRYQLDIASPLAFDGDGLQVENALGMCLAEHPTWTRDAHRGSRHECYEVTKLAGASLLISRRAFETIGGFDPIYFMYYEDFDLCRLARACRFRIGIITSSYIRHYSKLNRLERISVWRFFHTVRGGAIYHLSDPARPMDSNFWATSRFFISLVRAAHRYHYISRLPVLSIIILRLIWDLSRVRAKYQKQRQIIAKTCANRETLALSN